MHIAIIQHEPNEWIGSMSPWFHDKGYQLSTSKLYLSDPLPRLDEFDWLIIMGGGMSVYQEEKYPWLIAEKKLIRDAITAAKKVLGICLGAQLIASAMGGDVYPAEQKEIGWFEVSKTDAIASWLPDTFRPLSWHGDRFDLPHGATGFAKSDITPHQGFCLNNKVWGLQFHLEATRDSVRDFYAASGTLPRGRYVQTMQQMMAMENATQSQSIMHALLEKIDAA